MLKALRYDFYKIFKSKVLLGVFVASICLSVFDALWVGLHYASTFFCEYLSRPNVVQYLPLVFAVPFACKDFSSKFNKNVFSEYSLKDKICYVLSKIVYIFAVNLIWYILFFLSYYAFVSLRCHVQNVPFVFEYIMDDGTLFMSASGGIFSYFCVIINAFALEMVLLFLSVLMKKEYFILVVFILYYFLAPVIYGIIEKVIGPMDIRFHEFEWFTVFGVQINLRGLWTADEKIMMGVYTQCFLVSLGYSVLFGFLSCLAVSAKKDV